jgi:hypothetical protein
MGNNDDDTQLGIEEIIIPLISWTLLCGQYVYLWKIGAFAKQLQSSQGDMDAGRYFSY